MRRQKTLYRERREVVYVVKRRNAECLLKSKEICLPQELCYKQFYRKSMPYLEAYEEVESGGSITGLDQNDPNENEVSFEEPVSIGDIEPVAKEQSWDDIFLSLERASRLFAKRPEISGQQSTDQIDTDVLLAELEPLVQQENLIEDLRVCVVVAVGYLEHVIC